MTASMDRNLVLVTRGTRGNPVAWLNMLIIQFFFLCFVLRNRSCNSSVHSFLKEMSGRVTINMSFLSDALKPCSCPTLKPGRCQHAIPGRARKSASEHSFDGEMDRVFGYPATGENRKPSRAALHSESSSEADCGICARTTSGGPHPTRCGAA